MGKPLLDLYDQDQRGDQVITLGNEDAKTITEVAYLAYKGLPPIFARDPSAHLANLRHLSGASEPPSDLTKQTHASLVTLRGQWPPSHGPNLEKLGSILLDWTVERTAVAIDQAVRKGWLLFLDNPNQEATQ